MIIQYGYIIHRNKNWIGFTLRVIQILPDREEGDGGCVGVC